ncbi:ATP-binding cassette domain-containing protein [Rhodobacteraceae bacterium 2376]|uniref:ATP-binding cassette domain-containing protein n=1 Tax=Rhabdonatronobacter sediminivivens TaxID=2743469 RepID=A0A7Z0I0N6_9RHOB|nr:ATP-binding cassette domain-containing protein [Rhabdonatronobacter sediminivivens]NYS25728.1 ATP-binding cassette domain-containing protein [Rhabdonatronobacter sediminivivens]
MLQLDGVTIVQGDFRLEADLTLESGARVAVLGPSGAGKSTLLGAIAGFVPLSTGRVTLDGEDLSTLAPGARPLSILFQDNNLFPHLSAAQNVALGLRPSLRLTGTEQEKVDAALERVGLELLGGRRPAQLSGGQQSRVALARALLRRRPLLLLDEPFAALGPALKTEMLALVREILNETGAMLLMVTHDPEDARAIASQAIVVTEGEAARPAPLAALLDNPPDALASYLGRRRGAEPNAAHEGDDHSAG